jgi:hypothetical protein
MYKYSLLGDMCTLYPLTYTQPCTYTHYRRPVYGLSPTILSLFPTPIHRSICPLPLSELVAITCDIILNTIFQVTTGGVEGETSKFNEQTQVS